MSATTEGKANQAVCPVCGGEADETRRVSKRDALDVECGPCGEYCITGPERADVQTWTRRERLALSEQLGDAGAAGVRLLLTRDFSRRILEDGWRVAPRLSR